jgi:hypothetical protein
MLSAIQPSRICDPAPTDLGHRRQDLARLFGLARNRLAVLVAFGRALILARVTRVGEVWLRLRRQIGPPMDGAEAVQVEKVQDGLLLV